MITIYYFLFLNNNFFVWCKYKYKKMKINLKDRTSDLLFFKGLFWIFFLSLFASARSFFLCFILLPASGWLIYDDHLTFFSSLSSNRKIDTTFHILFEIYLLCLCLWMSWNTKNQIYNVICWRLQDHRND